MYPIFKRSQKLSFTTKKIITLTKKIMKNYILSSLIVTLYSSSLIFSQCIEGDCINGKGTFVSGNHKYSGEWEDGKRSGEGTYYFPNGYTYSGTFLDGQRNGSGTFLYKEGYKYEGEWKKNDKMGEGTLRLSIQGIENKWGEKQAPISFGH